MTIPASQRVRRVSAPPATLTKRSPMRELGFGRDCIL
jgi:hypothetical protein